MNEILKGLVMEVDVDQSEVEVLQLVYVDLVIGHRQPDLRCHLMKLLVLILND